MSTLAENLTFAQQMHVHDTLADTTLGHIDRNAGLFEKLDFDPVANPSQDLRNVHLPAVTTTPEESDSLATQAGPRLYPFIKDSLLTQGALMGVLRRKRSEHTTKGNVFPVNIHQTMPDIALVLAAMSIAEHDLFETPWHEIVNTNGLIISRGVSTLQAFGLAASEVVQKGSHTFLSFPRTQTMQEITQEEVLNSEVNFDKLFSENNKLMKSELMDWLPSGISGFTDMSTIHPEPKKRTFVAWEGTTVKVKGDDPYNPEEISMEQANHALLEPLKRGIILPMVTWDRGPDKDPIFITGDMKPIRKARDMDEIQEWQRFTLAKSLGLDDEKVTIKY